MIHIRSLLIFLIALFALIVAAGVTISRVGAASVPTFPASAIAATGGAWVSYDPPTGTALICIIVQSPAALPPCAPPDGPVFIPGAAPGAGVNVYAFDATITPTAEAHTQVPAFAVYLPGVITP